MKTMTLKAVIALVVSEALGVASFRYEKMREAGGALAGLGAELLGITQVKDKCFA